MKSVSGKQLSKALEQHGWELQRVRGSHHIFAQPENPTILSVPVHGKRPLKRGTLRSLLKHAGLSEDDL